MTLLKIGLIAAGVLGFASFVYYRVQTIPQPPQLEISFGQAGADANLPQGYQPGMKLFKGKTTIGPMNEPESEE